MHCGNSIHAVSTLLFVILSSFIKLCMPYQGEIRRELYLIPLVVRLEEKHYNDSFYLKMHDDCCFAFTKYATHGILHMKAVSHFNQLKATFMSKIFTHLSLLALLDKVMCYCIMMPIFDYVLIILLSYFCRCTVNIW